MAMIPQKVMNAYPNVPDLGGIYEDGDFLVHLKGCAEGEDRSCEREFQNYFEERIPLK